MNFSIKQNPENLLKNPKIKLPQVSIKFLPNILIMAIEIFLQPSYPCQNNKYYSMQNHGREKSDTQAAY